MPTLTDHRAPWTQADLAQHDREIEANEIVKASIGLRSRIHLHLERAKAGGTSRFADGDELDTLIAALDALVVRYEEE